MKSKKEAKQEIQVYIDQLSELAELNDMRDSDVKRTLRDINFVRGEVGLERMSTVELMEYMI